MEIKDQRKVGNIETLESNYGKKFSKDVKKLLSTINVFFFIDNKWKIDFECLAQMVTNSATTVKALNKNGDWFICSNPADLLPEKAAICTLPVEDNKKVLLFVYLGK